MTRIAGRQEGENVRCHVRVAYFCNLRALSEFFFHLVMVVSTSEDFSSSSIFDELFIDPCLPERQVLREGLKKGDVSSQVNNIGW